MHVLAQAGRERGGGRGEADSSLSTEPHTGLKAGLHMGSPWCSI